MEEKGGDDGKAVDVPITDVPSIDILSSCFLGDVLGGGNRESELG